MQPLWRRRNTRYRPLHESPKPYYRTTVPPPSPKCLHTSVIDLVPFSLHDPCGQITHVTRSPMSHVTRSPVADGDAVCRVRFGVFFLREVALAAVLPPRSPPLWVQPKSKKTEKNCPRRARHPKTDGRARHMASCHMATGRLLY